MQYKATKIKYGFNLIYYDTQAHKTVSDNLYWFAFNSLTDNNQLNRIKSPISNEIISIDFSGCKKPFRNISFIRKSFSIVRSGIGQWIIGTDFKIS
jgi:hypothetical protein